MKTSNLHQHRQAVHELTTDRAPSAAGPRRAQPLGLALALLHLTGCTIVHGNPTPEHQAQEEHKHKHHAQAEHNEHKSESEHSSEPEHHHEGGQPSHASSETPHSSSSGGAHASSGGETSPGHTPPAGMTSGGTTPAAPPQSNQAATQSTISNIVVPVSASFDDLVKKLDSLLPATAQEDWTQIKDGEPTVDVKYQVWRDPIQATFDGSGFEITVPFHYAADFRAKAKVPIKGTVWITKDETWGTKSEPQHLTAKVRVQLGVSGDWKIQADGKLESLEHGAAPSGKICEVVCITKAEIAPYIHKRMNEYLTPKIEKGLAGAPAQLEKAFNLKAQAGKVWTALQKPMQIQNPAQKDCPTMLGSVCKEQAWIGLQPEAIGMSPPKLDHGNLNMELSIAGRLAVVVGAKPASKNVPLPALQQINEPAGFHILARVLLALDALGSAVGQEIKGLALTGPGQQLQVKSVSVLAHNDPAHPQRVTLQLDLGGSVEAKADIYGDLAYDFHSQSLTFGNVDYTVDTQNGFVKKFAHLEHATFLKALSGKARFSLAQHTAPLKSAVLEALNQTIKDQLKISGQLPTIGVQDVVVKSDSIGLDMVLDGALAVSYLGT